MFEISFECESSMSDYILLRFLLQAIHYRWHTFEVCHNKFRQARIYFKSPTNDCLSTVACLACKEIEDIDVR